MIYQNVSNMTKNKKLMYVS